MNRRHVLAGVAGTAIAGTAGAFVLFRNDLTEHRASPVSVEAGTRADTGYEETGVEDVVVSEDVGGVEEVVVRNYMTEHEKSVDMGPLGQQRGAVFITLSTPRLNVAGREFNPVEEMSTDELVQLVQDNYDGIENVRRDEEATVTILERSTPRTRYTAQAEFDGSSVDVDLHVSQAVATEDDLVVTIGVYPRDLRSIEEANVLELMEGVVDELPGSYDGESGDDIDEDDGSATDDDQDQDDGTLLGGQDDDAEEDEGDSDDEEDGDGNGDGDEEDGDGDGNGNGDDGLLTF